MNESKSFCSRAFIITSRNDQAPRRVTKHVSQKVTKRDFVITKPCTSMDNDIRIDHLRARRKQPDEPPTTISCASCDIYRLSRWLDSKGWLRVISVGWWNEIRKSLVENRLVRYSLPRIPTIKDNHNTPPWKIIKGIPIIIIRIFQEYNLEKKRGGEEAEISTKEKRKERKEWSEVSCVEKLIIRLLTEDW